MLSGKAQLLKTEIADLLQNTSNDELQNRLAAFREHLIANLSEDDFADMMAQTITYSLFAARCYHTHGKFNRTRAIEILAETNPFLSQLFWVSIQRLTQLHWIIDPIAELLDLANMESITADFGTEGKEAGPIVHFYEDFLSDYDPQLRKQGGVYYTPEPIVSYIVRSVDALLTAKFNLSDGLAHTGTVDVNGKQLPKVQILDPAAGTGTFLRSVISQIYHIIMTSGVAGAWQEYVPQHLLPRIHGFERMVAPYAMCHLTLTYQLAELGYHLKADERLNVYLTDTLEAGNSQRGIRLFIDEIAKEAEAAATVKRDYASHGDRQKSTLCWGNQSNTGEWITEISYEAWMENIQTEDYFNVDGRDHLMNDNVKMVKRRLCEIYPIRPMAHCPYRVWQSSLSSPTTLTSITLHFAVCGKALWKLLMRSISSTCTEIRRTNEKPPNGGPDENVFRNPAGGCHQYFCQTRRRKNKNSRRVSITRELWGNREDKYNWLEANTH